MKRSLLAYLKLTRPVNLLIIAATQLLFWYGIIEPVYGVFDRIPNLDNWQALLIILSTVLIAAGGYAINDYYDQPIDLVNKPDKVLIGRGVSDDGAFNYYIALTGTGLTASLAVAWSLGEFTHVLFPVVIASLLWFYAQDFKRRLLIGNLIVAFSTAGVIFILILFEIDWAANSMSLTPAVNDLLKFSLFYMSFAFLTTMAREAVKDLEDMEGDAQFDCRTLPIVWGVRGGKAAGTFWIAAVMAGLIWLSVRLGSAGNTAAVIYIVLFLVLPSGVAGYMLLRAGSREAYGQVSLVLKIVMAFGLLTMIYIGYILGMGR